MCVFRAAAPFVYGRVLLCCERSCFTAAFAAFCNVFGILLQHAFAVAVLGLFYRCMEKPLQRLHMYRRFGFHVECVAEAVVLLPGHAGKPLRVMLTSL